jgi:predicted Abi (CAAX) family protease
MNSTITELTLEADAFSNFWSLIGGALQLRSAPYRAIDHLEHGLAAALSVLLLAGLSSALGQAIVLFVRRTRPGQFAIGLGSYALVYVIGYLLGALTLWLTVLVFLHRHLPIRLMVEMLALAYAPRLFAALGALPYLGVPITQGLALWTLLSLLLGLKDVLGLNAWQALAFALASSLIGLVLERSLRRPLLLLSRLLGEKVQIDLGLRSGLTRLEERINQAVNQRLQAAQQEPGSAAIAPAKLAQGATSRRHPVMNWVAGLIGLAISLPISLGILALIWPAAEWYLSLTERSGWFLGLVLIALLLFCIGALLAPLEALGWWAGWYGSQLPSSPAQETRPAVEEHPPIERYVIYLDGIAQARLTYFPDVEDFLQRLRAHLPKQYCLVEGVMPYSALNLPLDDSQDPLLKYYWRLATRAQTAKRTTLISQVLSTTILLRNLLKVAVSADSRYGPIYNLAIARNIYDSLLAHGYLAGSGVPLTFVGYSGGGQMALAAAPYLREALAAPTDIISLAGVFSGNHRFLRLGQIYQLKGRQDRVEPLGALLFPKRWPVQFLSYWNRAKRLGKVTFLSLGPVGHNALKGPLDTHYVLPDGRSALDHTSALIVGLVSGSSAIARQAMRPKPSNYSRYQALAWNRPQAYPPRPAVALNPDQFQPVAPWIGRLILPPQELRSPDAGVLCELHQAPEPYAHLVGQQVWLRWQSTPELNLLRRQSRTDLNFSDEANNQLQQGLILPTRLNHWRQVDLLESLAGAYPEDDLLVRLTDPLQVELTTPDRPTLRITQEPVQISGCYVALIQILAPEGVGNRWQVRHFNRASGCFDGPEASFRFPKPSRDINGISPSSVQALASHPGNRLGWYAYGQLDATGEFTVVAILPRALVRLQSAPSLTDARAALTYIRDPQQLLPDPQAPKGNLCNWLLRGSSKEWQEGDRALVLHCYGGIGGPQGEPAAQGPIYFGHFAFGVATVVRDPLSTELIFDLDYCQVYTQNIDGILSARQSWTRYLGDRQYGWLGTRPTLHLLLKLECFTQPFAHANHAHSALSALESALAWMMARYRVGDGAGVTLVGPAYNCSVDSNQALFQSLQRFRRNLSIHAVQVADWRQRYPQEAGQLDQLLQLERQLQRFLNPLGIERPDWRRADRGLGLSPEEHPFRQLGQALLSWHTILPRVAFEDLAEIFLRQGASCWLLATFQIGTDQAGIEPRLPLRLPL